MLSIDQTSPSFTYIERTGFKVTSSSDEGIWHALLCLEYVHEHCKQHKFRQCGIPAFCEVPFVGSAFNVWVVSGPLSESRGCTLSQDALTSVCR